MAGWISIKICGNSCRYPLRKPRRNLLWNVRTHPWRNSLRDRQRNLCKNSWNKLPRKIPSGIPAQILGWVSWKITGRKSKGIPKKICEEIYGGILLTKPKRTSSISLWQNPQRNFWSNIWRNNWKDSQRFPSVIPIEIDGEIVKEIPRWIFGQSPDKF